MGLLIYYFKSNYYQREYVPYIDLSAEALSKYLLKEEHPEIADRVQQLISQDRVKEVLNQPLCYTEPEIQKRNQIITEHGFTLLSAKLVQKWKFEGYQQQRIRGSFRTELLRPTFKKHIECLSYYSVIHHNDVPNYVIKTGARRIPKNDFLIGPQNNLQEFFCFTKYESLLRIAMRERIAQIARENRIEVILPRKYLVAYENSDHIKNPLEKYCVVADKLEVLSKEDTLSKIQEMNAEEQIHLANKIATLVSKAGFVDASFDNIRLNSQRQIVILDTEPGGLMRRKKGIGQKIFGRKPHSIDKCARIGLFNLRQNISRAAFIKVGTATKEQCSVCQEGLENFWNTITDQYQRAMPKYSKKRIIVSCVIPVIPLWYVITTLARTIFLIIYNIKLVKSQDKFNDSLQEPLQNIRKNHEEETTRSLQAMEDNHSRKLGLLTKSCLKINEGTPFRLLA